MVTLTVRYQTRSSIKLLNVVVKILPLITKQIRLYYYTCQNSRGNTRESYQHISYFIYFYTFTKIENKMDLLQESSSIWDEFLRRPCPQVDPLSFWPLAPFVPWQPWHLLNSDTLILLVLWHPWHLLSPDTFGTVHYSMVQRHSVLYFGFLIFRGFCTVLYCTVLYCTIPYYTESYYYFSYWYIPLNQAIYAWSFRQKFAGWVVVGGDIAIIASSSRGPGET